MFLFPPLLSMDEGTYEAFYNGKSPRQEEDISEGGSLYYQSEDCLYLNTWNPYLCMEVGVTRQISEKTNANEWDRTVGAYPPATERMSIEEMILGYTINGAIQLGIEASKGSIEVGKDADFLVFDDDLLAAEPEGFSHHKPSEAYFCGKKAN